MADILAQITQLINNSPQVGSLVGGQMAAEEVARQQVQAAEALRRERALRRRVLALEKSTPLTGESLTQRPDGSFKAQPVLDTRV